MTVDWQDLEAIKRCKYKYMRCLDQKLWRELRDCFSEAAVASYSGGKYRYEGREAILSFLERSMGADTFHSSHRVHHPEIDFTSATCARGTWALDDVVIDTKWNLTIHGAAFYEDEYVRESDGVWRISRTGYKRTFEEVLPRGAIQGLRLTASWWSTEGRSELDAG